jgi:hypothetical protein
MLVPKRAESCVDDPITLTPTFHFPADDPEARDIAHRLHETMQAGGEVLRPPPRPHNV